MRYTALVIISSMIIGAWLIGFMSPRQTGQSTAEVGHLYSVSAGLVHRERALLETLNKKGYITSNEATRIRQML